MSDKLRMKAYYYAFTPTGVPAIDRILSAVACAGKAYHGTECWNDECCYTPAGHVGKTPVEWIQGAADDAARALAGRATASAPDPCDPVFNCRGDWHEIGCPKRTPSPPCTCKMPIGFGRSFRGFMAPDPKCAFHSPAPLPASGEGKP